jgi:hypothetical protein
VSSLAQNLRSNVVRCATESAFALAFKSNLTSQSKVSDFEIMTRGEEEVTELEVAVDDVLRLHVLDCIQ